MPYFRCKASLHLLALFTFLLGVLNPSFAQTTSSYAGSYAGSYSGGDSGSWTVSITSSGALTLSGSSSKDGSSFSGSGNVSASGALSMTTGTTSEGSTFTGTINATTGAVSGSWTNQAFGVGGSFSGSRTSASTTTTTTSTTSTTIGSSTTTTQIYPLNLSAGWNLLGNSTSSMLNISDIINRIGLDVVNTYVSTIWKWNPASAKWAFYAPSLTLSQLTAYAANKGYDVLGTIAPGEGFWLNAKSAFSLDSSGTPHDKVTLAQGWNLVATGLGITPAKLNDQVNSASGQDATSYWAWSNTDNKWVFYAPSLAKQGSLTTYIQQKGYLDFTTALGGSIDTGHGVWINTPAAAEAQLLTLSSGGVTSTVPTTSGNFSKKGDVHKFAWSDIAVGRIYQYGGYNASGNNTQSARTENSCQFRRNADGSASELAGTTELARYEWEDTTLAMVQGQGSNPPVTRLRLYKSHYLTGLPEYPYTEWIDIFPSATNPVMTVIYKAGGTLCVDWVWRGGYDAMRFEDVGSADFSLKPLEGTYQGTVAGWQMGGDNLGFHPLVELPPIQVKISNTGHFNITLGTGTSTRIFDFKLIDNRKYVPPLDLINLNTFPIAEFEPNKYRMFDSNPYQWPGPNCVFLLVDPNNLYRYKLYFGCKNYDAAPGTVDWDGYIDFGITKVN